MPTWSLTEDLRQRLERVLLLNSDDNHFVLNAAELRLINHALQMTYPQYHYTCVICEQKMTTNIPILFHEGWIEKLAHKSCVMSLPLREDIVNAMKNYTILDDL